MSRWLRTLWWLPTLAALPVLLPLAIHTRRTALRLPPASGSATGQAGQGEPMLRLLAIGESTVAGVGVDKLGQALTAQVAEALAEGGRAVRWSAFGENGITAHEAAERLLPAALQESAELVLLVFGVNDTTHFSSQSQWLDGLTRLADAWQARGAQVVVTAVPPLGHFSALPWLMRRLLGWRGRILDRELRALAQRLGLHYCAAGVEFEAEFLAEDGYHPSALGYRAWARSLAGQLRALPERQPAVRPAG